MYFSKKRKGQETTQCCCFPALCGATRIRTGDTRIFSPLLYQLSYGTEKAAANVSNQTGKRQEIYELICTQPIRSLHLIARLSNPVASLVIWQATRRLLAVLTMRVFRVYFDNAL